MWWRYVNGHRTKAEGVIPFEQMFPELARDPDEPPPAEKSPADIFYLAKMWALAQPGTVICSKEAHTVD